MGINYDPILSLQSRIASMAFSREPFDLGAHYRSVFGNPDNLGSLSVMPPTPGTLMFNATYAVDSSTLKVHYGVEFELRKGMLEVLRNRPTEQMAHRSRTIALSCRALQYFEYERRVNRAIELRDSCQQYALSESEADAVFDVIIDTTIKHMKFDWSYCQAYMKEHATSSTGDGLRWSQLLEETTRDDWLKVFDQIVAFVESLGDRFRGYFIKTAFATGNRSRSEEFTAAEIMELVDSLRGEVTRTIERERLIFFFPSHSIWAIFITDKTAWYNEILTQVISLLGIDGDEISFPVAVGGQVYVQVSEWLYDGNEQFSFDGVTWDALVGTILGTVFACLLLLLDGTLQLPSGETVTTLLGTIAMLCVYRRRFNGKKATILSDDITIFSKSPVAKTGDIIDYQEEDTRRGFVLGVNYAEDPLRPVLDGLKITSDRADLRRNIEEATDELNQTGWIKGHHSHGEQLLYYGMYFGYYGTMSLIDAIKTSDTEKQFQGPTQNIMDMAGAQVTLDTATAWLNEVGLKVRDMI